MMTADEALAMTESAGFADTAKAILADEVRRLRDEVNGLTGSLDRAEKALKEAQEQEPVAWLCGADVAQNKDYAEWFTAFTKESAIPLYARPVPAAPAVAAPAVPDEWREVLRECADDLAIELDMRYQSRSHYPSELRKYENEMQPVYRARSLLQSADHSELAIEKVAPDCRACAILPCSCK